MGKIPAALRRARAPAPSAPIALRAPRAGRARCGAAAEPGGRCSRLWGRRAAAAPLCPLEEEI